MLLRIEYYFIWERQKRQIYSVSRSPSPTPTCEFFCSNLNKYLFGEIIILSLGIPNNFLSGISTCEISELEAKMYDMKYSSNLNQELLINQSRLVCETFKKFNENLKNSNFVTREKFSNFYKLTNDDFLYIWGTLLCQSQYGWRCLSRSSRKFDDSKKWSSWTSEVFWVQRVWFWHWSDFLEAFLSL